MSCHLAMSSSTNRSQARRSTSARASCNKIESTLKRRWKQRTRARSSSVVGRSTSHNNRYSSSKPPSNTGIRVPGSTTRVAWRTCRRWGDGRRLRLKRSSTHAKTSMRPSLMSAIDSSWSCRELTSSLLSYCQKSSPPVSTQHFTVDVLPLFFFFHGFPQPRDGLCPGCRFTSFGNKDSKRRSKYIATKRKRRTYTSTTASKAYIQ